MLDGRTPRVLVRVWTILAMRGLRVCCRAILLVLMATTVSDHDLRGGLMKIVRHASVELRVWTRAHASLSMFAHTASVTTSLSWPAQPKGIVSVVLVIAGSEMPTTPRLST